jgi:hypothetical protein
MLIISGNSSGADVLSISQGDGYDQPRLLSAAAQDFHTVRVVFSTHMLYFSEYGGLLSPLNYSITVGSDPLAVLRVDTVSSTTFDLTTDEQLNVIYTLEVSNVYDQYGALIDPAYDSTSFVGVRSDPGTKTDLYVFSGTEAGIDGVEATGFMDIDDEPPVITNEDPVPDARFVPITRNLVYFDVTDEYSGVVLPTLDAYIDGYWAFKGGAFQSPFTGPDSYVGAITPGGTWEGYAFRFDYEHLWEADKQIDIRVIAEDSFGNATDTTWHFDTPADIPPELRNLDPAANETLVSRNREIIEFDIVSTSKTEVIGDTIDAYVNGALVFEDESFSSPFDGPDAYYGALVTIEGYDGYKVKLDYTNTPWYSYQLINVRVKAQDAYGFWADEIYSFRIEDIEEPIFADVYPDPGTSFIDQDTLIWADFYDTGSGINANSVEVYVNNDRVFDGYNFVPSYNGPQSAITPKTFDSYDGYRVTVDRVGSYKSGETVSVRVTVRDKEGN